jgi:hypothetical protein
MLTSNIWVPSSIPDRWAQARKVEYHAWGYKPKHSGSLYRFADLLCIFDSSTYCTLFLHICTVNVMRLRKEFYNMTSRFTPLVRTGPQRVCQRIYFKQHWLLWSDFGKGTRSVYLSVCHSVCPCVVLVSKCQLHLFHILCLTYHNYTNTNHTQHMPY